MPSLLRAARVDRLAGQQQVERRGRADQPRQALHAAPAGHDAEHHFGQAEPRAGLVDDDAIAARERQLESAAQAEAADQRERRIRDARRAARTCPSRAGRARARRPRSSTSPNSSTSAPAMKPFALPDADDEPLRRIAVELVERLVQLRRAPARQRVGRRAGRSNVSAREAVGVAGDESSVCIGLALVPVRRHGALDQHRAALAAADADRGHAALAAGALAAR